MPSVFSNKVMPLNISLSSGSDIAGLQSDPLTILVMAPTSKKWGAYWFRLVRPSVCVSVPSK